MTILTKNDMKQLTITSVLVASVFMLTACFDDNDTPIENAAEEVSEGIEEAGEALQPDRSLGEKMGDAVEDAGEDIQDAAE